MVGFDDIPEAPYFMPPLTTVRQDFIEVGSRSLRLLVRTIEAGERSPSGSLVAPELIVRASTTDRARSGVDTGASVIANIAPREG